MKALSDEWLKIMNFRTQISLIMQEQCTERGENGEILTTTEEGDDDLWLWREN
jgi:hypothetical protein